MSVLKILYNKINFCIPTPNRSTIDHIPTMITGSDHDDLVYR